MDDLLADMTNIQKMTFEAYKSTGQALAMLDLGQAHGAGLARVLDLMSGQFEKSAVALRNICEKHRPSPLISPSSKHDAPPVPHAGSLSVNGLGWVEIKLNALLPNCRYGSPLYISDTLRRLMDGYEQKGDRLPRFERAMLIIDEHCDIKSRQVYDQDNKGWKAVPNALKGRVIKDDDQFSLHVCLLSRRASDPCCRIYLIDQGDAGVFFRARYEKHPVFT